MMSNTIWLLLLTVFYYEHVIVQSPIANCMFLDCSNPQHINGDTAVSKQMPGEMIFDMWMSLCVCL